MTQTAADKGADALTPTLFEWAGGDAAIRRLINAYYDRVEADELLSPFFPGGVSAEHRDHVSQAADAHLPADPEFRAALVGYLEWGTQLAVTNSQSDAQPALHAPVPHWGWGVAPPYQP